MAEYIRTKYAYARMAECYYYLNDDPDTCDKTKMTDDEIYISTSSIANFNGQTREWILAHVAAEQAYARRTRGVKGYTQGSLQAKEMLKPIVEQMINVPFEDSKIQHLLDLFHSSLSNNGLLNDKFKHKCQ